MRQPCHVFVVDDEPIISSTLTTILNAKGFHALGFTDPIKALNSAQVDLPDYLISDVMMPKLTGVELAIKMRLVCPTCKVLLISGQASFESFLESAVDQGYDFRLLQKPIDPDTLLAEIAVA